MSHRLSLEQIKIAEPCHESWDAMSGDAQKRFCDSCAKHVHDLSTMTREEAEALVNRGESVCIRMQRDTGGTVKTKPTVTSARDATNARDVAHARDAKADRFPPRWMRAAASVAAMLGITSLFQGGCKPADKTIQGTPLPPETPHVRTMGIVALPEPKMGEVAPTQGEVAPLQGSIAPSTQPTEPMFEMGDVAAPAAQPVEPMVMGRIAAPATQPTTRPTTQPTVEPIKMGKIAPPATQPTLDTAFWKTSPYIADEGFLLPSDD